MILPFTTEEMGILKKIRIQQRDCLARQFAAKRGKRFAFFVYVRNKDAQWMMGFTEYQRPSFLIVLHRTLPNPSAQQKTINYSAIVLVL